MAARGRDESAVILDVPIIDQHYLSDPRNPSQPIVNTCGECCIAMCLDYLMPEKHITVDHVIKYALGAKYFDPEDPLRLYTSPANLIMIAQHYCETTISGQVTSSSPAEVLRKFIVDMRLPVILDVRSNFSRLGCSHFVVVRGVDANGDFVINDPWSRAELTTTGQIWVPEGGSYTLPFAEMDVAWNSHPDDVDRFYLVMATTSATSISLAARL
ncbi:hypothetical protein Pelo_14998 [Pelomyxa schiedti]|nr:hypothetical protein Pelo_14998 [Pelomyxa schiedti]